MAMIGGGEGEGSIARRRRFRSAAGLVRLVVGGASALPRARIGKI
jgi:hypothetical protein